MNTRERTLALRQGEPKITAAEIARRLGVSRERIRQILASEGLSTGGSKAERLKKQLRRKEYQCWWNMLDRCSNPKNPAFRHYGGRGISVAVRWRDFDNFFEDMGPRPGLGYSIERIDNDGNYTPSNCKWATKEEQTRNQRFRQKPMTKKEALAIWKRQDMTGKEKAAEIGLSVRQIYRWLGETGKPRGGRVA